MPVEQVHCKRDIVYGRAKIVRGDLQEAVFDVAEATQFEDVALALVLQPLEMKLRAHARGEHFKLRRLGDVVVRTEVQPAHNVVRLVERGEHDHRHPGSGRLGTQRLEHFQPVHAGHHHVQQNEVGRIGTQGFEGFERVVIRDRIEPL